MPPIVIGIERQIMTTRPFTHLFVLRRCFAGLSLLLGLVPSYAQGSAEPVGSKQANRFQKNIQPLLNQRCVMCHQEGSAPGGLSLDSANAYRSLVGAPSTQAPLARVSPGLPDKSYLWRKLSGTHVEAGGSGSRMPLGGEMPAEEMSRLRTWIEQGAKPN
jgi:uncharacterized membrane protein